MIEALHKFIIYREIDDDCRPVREGDCLSFPVADQQSVPYGSPQLRFQVNASDSEGYYLHEVIDPLAEGGYSFSDDNSYEDGYVVFAGEDRRNYSGNVVLPNAKVAITLDFRRAAGGLAVARLTHIWPERSPYTRLFGSGRPAEPTVPWLSLREGGSHLRLVVDNDRLRPNLA